MSDRLRRFPRLRGELGEQHVKQSRLKGSMRFGWYRGAAGGTKAARGRTAQASSLFSFGWERRSWHM